MNKKFSIIIPCKDLDPHSVKCLESCLQLDYENFEIIMLPDEKIDDLRYKDARVRIIPTGPVRPSAKRNIAIQNSQADFLAFVDSDAYPVKDWLANAVKYFDNPEAGAIGGPNLTPPGSSAGQMISGHILSSPLSAGKFAMRYRLTGKSEYGLPVREMPSCNLITRRELAQRLGGFDQGLLTGEDSKFCFGIRKLGKRVVYAPDVVVYHHRRDLWKPHLKQMWIYARDKAWVVKEDFSFDKLYYSAPFLFVIFLAIGSALSFFSPLVKMGFLSLLGVYLGINLLNSVVTDWRLSPRLFLGVILTHISYGLGFFYGLTHKRIK